MQDWSTSATLTMELLQSYTKPSILGDRQVMWNIIQISISPNLKQYLPIQADLIIILIDTWR